MQLIQTKRNAFALIVYINSASKISSTSKSTLWPACGHQGIFLWPGWRLGGGAQSSCSWLPWCLLALPARDQRSSPQSLLGAPGSTSADMWGQCACSGGCRRQPGAVGLRVGKMVRAATSRDWWPHSEATRKSCLENPSLGRGLRNRGQEVAQALLQSAGAQNSCGAGSGRASSAGPRDGERRVRTTDSGKGGTSLSSRGQHRECPSKSDQTFILVHAPNTRAFACIDMSEKITPNQPGYSSKSSSCVDLALDFTLVLMNFSSKFLVTLAGTAWPVSKMRGSFLLPSHGQHLNCNFAIRSTELNGVLQRESHSMLSLQEMLRRLFKQRKCFLPLSLAVEDLSYLSCRKLNFSFYILANAYNNIL